MSEWMGYTLLYESMLPTVLYARDRYLRPGGLMLPSSCTLAIAASSHSRLSFWDDVYGFDMAPVKATLVKEASIEVVPGTSLLSEPAPFRAVDCTATDDASLDFSVEFTLRVVTDGSLRSWILEFDTVFDCTPAGGVRTAFTTSCRGEPTHWKQTALYLKEPVAVKAGDAIRGTVSFSRAAGYKRAYDIAVGFAINGAAAELRATQLWSME